MQEYLLVLSTYNQETTIKVDLSKQELELLEDIGRSLDKQNATIRLEVKDV